MGCCLKGRARRCAPRRCGSCTAPWMARRGTRRTPPGGAQTWLSHVRATERLFLGCDGREREELLVSRVSTANKLDPVTQLPGQQCTSFQERISSSATNRASCAYIAGRKGPRRDGRLVMIDRFGLPKERHRTSTVTRYIGTPSAARESLTTRQYASELAGVAALPRPARRSAAAAAASAASGALR